MNKINSLIPKILFIGIVFLAIYLRFSGITNGYPPYHSDEGMSYSQGLAMLKEGLDAHGYPLAYAYPNIVPIVNALAFKFIFIPVSWVLFWISNIGQILEGFIHIPPTEIEYRNIYQLKILGEREINVLIWGRMVSAFIGVLTVVISFFFAKDISKEENNLQKTCFALLVAFLVAINYRQVLNSHINLPDIYNAFFLTFAIWMSYRLWKKPTRTNYLIAGIFAAISFSVKFNIYVLFPLCLSHIYIVLNKRANVIKNLFLSPGIYISACVFVLGVILINPYHLINFNETIDLLHGVSGKYSTGKNMLDPYSYWYLYNIGLGKITSIFIVCGVVLGLIVNFKKNLFLLSPVIPAFLILTYLTGGGFYTRNFVAFTPVLLIFAAMSLLTITMKVASRSLVILLFSLSVIFFGVDNLPNSLVVAKEYTKPWNYLVNLGWLKNNLPQNAKVAVHPSVLLPEGKGVIVSSYDYNKSYSLEEFRNDGAEYAIANTDWTTNGFYGWMTDPGDDLFKFAKPVSKLENTYPAMSLRELSDFSVSHTVNPWQAPDSNFIVAKVPTYKVNKKTLVSSYDLNTQISRTNLWQSDTINIEKWSGFNIESVLKTESSIPDGYIWVKFYISLEDAKEDRNRTAIRLSARNTDLRNYSKINLIGLIPQDAKYMTIGMGLFDSAISAIEIKQIKIYNAEVEVDLNGVKIERYRIENNIIFPNSHGYL